MNVFVLNTGRCGSTTFIRACEHMENYSAGHETRIHLTGTARLDYPEDHIEADNRLCWMLGRLDERYADDAFYVHLYRDREQTASSFARRADFGIMQAWRQGVLLGGEEAVPSLELARDYVDAVESNIRLFLKDKTHRREVRLEQASEDFARFWQAIGARGDLDAALAEWRVRHNASLPAES
ncbi:hypothetical protein [Thiolapillus brandeum]|uniref:Sulfotransferase family protein n=1 Tax=Thiolapillus brandeum TaxID=1076588 RepID=A0A7U6GJF0_9GAMM|nr:hypothetical protein [Thiolapillus brandeum]BAO44699.1 conserved hypothetical protein [Thiolapillus brandeum]